MKPELALPPSNSSGRILVIDDEPFIAELLRDVFTRHGYGVQACFDGESGLRHATEGDFDLVVSDFAMPGSSGLDLARRVAQRNLRTRVIVVSAYLDADVHEALSAVGNVEAILSKPFDIFELVQHADRITGRSARSAESSRRSRAAEAN